MLKKNQKLFVKRTIADAIAILLEKAQEVVAIHPARSKRYVKMLFDLVKKHRITLTKEQKNKFCKKCFTFFILDKTARVFFNARNNSFYIQCTLCDYTRRI